MSTSISIDSIDLHRINQLASMTTHFFVNMRVTVFADKQPVHFNTLEARYAIPLSSPTEETDLAIEVGKMLANKLYTELVRMYPLEIVVEGLSNFYSQEQVRALSARGKAPGGLAPHYGAVPVAVKPTVATKDWNTVSRRIAEDSEKRNLADARDAFYASFDDGGKGVGT